MTASKPDTRVITFGCRLNYYESSIIRRHAELFSNQNIVVVNTCAVTAEAERQARQAIRRAHRELPGYKIIVTGCSAQITPDVYDNMEEVDAVVGNKEKLTAELFRSDGKPVNVGNIMDEHEVSSEILQNKDSRARAFVQIQTGCDHRCTFCVIPYGRGNSRSVPKEKILREIQSLIGLGYNEIVLTGVDITSYGCDLEPRTKLGTLVKNILREVRDLRRLRLSSLDPAELDETLWETLATNERLMPHLHLSVQAGHDLILKRMKRRHSRHDVVSCARKARHLRPGVTLGADIIAGFPTETDEMFKSTQSLIEECKFEFLHVFPYSIRKNTPAARMPMVPVEVRARRARTLRSIGCQIKHSLFKQSLGSHSEVLLEKPCFGRTKNNIPVTLSTQGLPNTVENVLLTDIENQAVLGRIV